MAGHPSHGWTARNSVTGHKLDVPECSRCGAAKGSTEGTEECTLPAQQGPQRTEEQIQAQALPDEVIGRIRSSVLCVSNSDGDVIATAIVWDYTATHVLLLTNYHTWDSSAFRYCFPPVKMSSKGKGKRKRDTEPVVVTLHNDEDGFCHELTMRSAVFHSCEKDADFAVLRIPKAGFSMPRIPTTLELSPSLKIHALGYVGHSKQFAVSGGEVTGLVAGGFTMNLLSAGGYSGAAILVNGCGRAVGYTGGSYDASDSENPRRQSCAFRIDHVMRITRRQTAPTSSSAAKGGSKVRATPK